MTGRTIANGYGRDHKRMRAAIANDLKRGHTHHCWRCGNPIRHGNRWHLGHDDWQRDANGNRVHRGAECEPCNLKHAGRKSALLRRLRRRKPSPPTDVTTLRW